LRIETTAAALAGVLFPVHAAAAAAARFTPTVAPTKATVFPLVQKEALNEHASKISAALTAAGLSNIIDTTGNGT
jgi:glycyl-tRNA synthetase (class II)